MLTLRSRNLEKALSSSFQFPPRTSFEKQVLAFCRAQAVGRDTRHATQLSYNVSLAVGISGHLFLHSATEKNKALRSLLRNRKRIYSCQQLIPFHRHKRLLERYANWESRLLLGGLGGRGTFTGHKDFSVSALLTVWAG